MSPASPGRLETDGLGVAGFATTPACNALSFDTGFANLRDM